jgi:hypothetical protein
MSQIKGAISSTSLGDVAVDGLLGGLGAGIIMLLFLIITEFLGGVGPVTVLARFDLGSTASPLTGALTHLAVAGVYGLGFGILWALTAVDRLPAGLTGTIYGFALFILAETVMLPGTHSALLAIPIWSFALAHLVYGAMLGWLVQRTGRQARRVT